MNKAFNKGLKVFGQSYEETDVLDSAVLIMPLVFFIQPVRSFLKNVNAPWLIGQTTERPAIRQYTQADSENP
jgi:GH15 family glucan-1,4-alpha-glucosidase